MAEAPRTEPERVCFTCAKLFECPHREGNKDGCINYEYYRKDLNCLTCAGRHGSHCDICTNFSEWHR